MPDGNQVGLFCCQRESFRCKTAMGQGDGVIEAISFNKSKKSDRSTKSDKSFDEL